MEYTTNDIPILKLYRSTVKHDSRDHLKGIMAKTYEDAGTIPSTTDMAPRETVAEHPRARFSRLNSVPDTRRLVNLDDLGLPAPGSRIDRFALPKHFCEIFYRHY
jgi:hypothetical protein